MSKCLRCGAGSEWIQGKVPDEPKAGSELAAPTCSVKCEWHHSRSGECYETKCGNAFQFTNDGVRENDFKYCPFCGGTIVEKEMPCDHEFDAEDLPCAYCGKTADELGLSQNAGGQPRGKEI